MSENCRTGSQPVPKDAQARQPSCARQPTCGLGLATSLCHEWKQEWGLQPRAVPWWAPASLWFISERLKHIFALVDPKEWARTRQLPMRDEIAAKKMLMGDAALVHWIVTGCPVCASAFGAKPE